VNHPARIALLLSCLLLMLFTATAAHAAAVWDPITDAEKALKTDPLDPGSGAIVLFKRGQIEVQERGGLNWITRIRTYARIKILNESGRDAANVSLWANKAYRLSGVEGRTILPSGEIVPLDGSKVFRTRAVESGKRFAIIKTTFTFPAVEPGAIIEYQLEEFVDGFFVRPWTFDTEDLSTLRATLQTLVGERLELAQFPLDTNISKLTYKASSSVLGTGKATQTDFEVSNIPPIRDEVYGSPFFDRAVRVIFNPRRFAMSGQILPVIMDWNGVAELVTEWYKEFEKGSKAASAKARELTSGITDPRKRAEAIYSYLQQNFSSTGILGVVITGTADEMFMDKRGDPEDLSALYVTMAKAAKVDANLVLLTPRDWEVLIPNFPNYSQIGRAIVRVNLQGGPVLIDPSDPAVAFGELPWSQNGVMALVVNGNKVQQITIPQPPADQNVFTAKVSSKIADDWKVASDVEVTLRGAEAADLRSEFLEESAADLQKHLADYLSFGLPEAEAANITHSELRDASQPLALKAQIRYEMVEAGGPAQVLLNPWVADRYRTPMFTSTQRRSPVQFDFLKKRASESVWTLPANIRVDRLPQEVKLDNDLGSYSHSCRQEGSTVTCLRTFELKKMTMSTTAEYLNGKQFFEEMARHDRDVIVLRQQ